MSANEFESELFQNILAELESRGYKLAIAESLTGGLLSSNFVAIEGASKVFLGSVIAYQDSMKHSLLGVASEILETRGAVSIEVASAMASGVRRVFSRDTGFALETIASISTTGMASPIANPLAAGLAEPKPHGLVFVAVELPDREVECIQLNLGGSRNEIRRDSAIEAANLLLRSLRA